VPGLMVGRIFPLLLALKHIIGIVGGIMQ
jgi:hypothetical protein